MTFTWNPQNVNFTRQRLNIWEWLLKKEKFPWTPQNWKEFNIGQSPLLSNKLEDSSVLEISTTNLLDLLRKDKRFDWTQECQDAFESMKKQFTEELVLAMPDHSKPFQIGSNASKYATGVVLSQLDSNGDRHLVAFYSKTFSPAEWNYDIHDRELLAIIRPLEAWRHYIQGSGHTTIIRIWPLTKKPRSWTDDKPDGFCSYMNMTSN